MIGYIKCVRSQCEAKELFDYDMDIRYTIYDVIRLKETHEAGEIINGHWLICNEALIDDNDNDKGKYEKGYYVKVANLKLIKYFVTDLNYDDRKDMRKYNTELMNYTKFLSCIKVNTYEYIS